MLCGPQGGSPLSLPALERGSQQLEREGDSGRSSARDGGREQSDLRGRVREPVVV